MHINEDLVRVARLTADLGVAHLRDVANRTGFPASKVRLLWSQCPGFFWLDEAAGYGVQKRGGRNFLLEKVRKILSVTPACSLSELQNGLTKTNLMRKRPLPLPVLEAFCHHMGLEVSSALVSSRSPLLPEDVLSPIEYGLYRVLRTRGGIAHHDDFERHFRGLPCGHTSFEPVASRSPIILKLEHRIWRQTGFSPSADQVADLKRAIGPITPPCDVSDRVTLVDDEVIVIMPVSRRAREKGSGHVPQKWQEYLRGKYALFNDEDYLGELNAIGAEVIGLGKAHRLLGEGTDSIQISFNLRRRTARIVGLGGGA